ncbi:MAG: aldo/keto reductase [Ignavibacterium sp.]|nr:aldo/keto reductase [Ignavibacterium sp.]
MILAGIDEALQIMKTDYIDVVHLHSCSTEILQRGEVIDALLEAKKKGKIKFAAYSGENQALEFAINTGKFDSIMTSVNICDQLSLNKLIPIAKERHLGIIAKRPIANAPWKFSERPLGNDAEEYWLRWKEMNLPDSDNWLETFLRFTVFAEGVDSAIVGTTNINHLKKDVELIQKGPLDNTLVSQIKSAFRDNWNSLI